MSYIKQNKIKKVENRARRHARIRTRISGTSEIPRLSIFKSNKEIYAQIIDDAKSVTLVGASSLKMKGSLMQKAEKVGSEIAKLAESKKISKVVFDRGGFLYTGHVKALAEAARKNGLIF